MVLSNRPGNNIRPTQTIDSQTHFHAHNRGSHRYPTLSLCWAGEVFEGCQPSPCSVQRGYPTSCVKTGGSGSGGSSFSCMLEAAILQLMRAWAPHAKEQTNEHVRTCDAASAAQWEIGLSFVMFCEIASRDWSMGPGTGTTLYYPA